MSKVVCVHLLNDYSGSPLVLSQVVKGFVDSGYEVDLYTAHNGEGFLSDLEGVNYQYLPYDWHSNKWLTLLHLLFSQVVLFFQILRYYNTDAVIYINTILPFGAAIAAKLMGKRIIYHVHETSVRPLIFKNFLFMVAKWSADQSIFVSDYLREAEAWDSRKSQTVYNALSDKFLSQIKDYQKVNKMEYIISHNNGANIVKENDSKKIRQKDEFFKVLMLCSLKEYKGVREYVELARKLTGIQFTLVLNAEEAAIEHFFNQVTLPPNLHLFPAQKDVHPFYQEADLLMSLSHPLKWVETFGMTALEGMAYGLPVVVPPVGGIAEIVEDSVSGFHRDVRDLDSLADTVTALANNPQLYESMAANALKRANDFDVHLMNEKIQEIVFAQVN